MYSPAKPIDVVVLNAADNVCVAARSIEAGSPIDAAGERLVLVEPVRIGHKISSWRRSPRASRSSNMARPSALPPLPFPREAGSIATIWPPASSCATMRRRPPSRPIPRHWPTEPSWAIPGWPPRRHAKLHRRDFDRQLFGVGQPLCRPAFRSRNAEARFPPHRRCRRLHAWRRLRHAVQGTQSSGPQPRDGRSCPASEYRRLSADRLGLRNRHDRLAAGRTQPGANRRPIGRGRAGQRGSQPPSVGVEHAGSRRHAKND